MPDLKIHQRHMLKSKDVKVLRKKMLEQIPIENVNNLLSKSAKLEWIKLSNREELIAIDGVLCFWVRKDRYIPLMTLLLEDIEYKIKSVSVDKGAIIFVTNGANVMRPGITKIDSDIRKGDIIKIQDSIHNRVLAIGRALFDAQEMELKKTGNVIENIHTLNDKIWKFSKEFSSS